MPVKNANVMIHYLPEEFLPVSDRFSLFWSHESEGCILRLPMEDIFKFGSSNMLLELQRNFLTNYGID